MNPAFQVVKNKGTDNISDFLLALNNIFLANFSSLPQLILLLDKETYSQEINQGKEEA